MAETKLSGNQVEGIQNSANNKPLQIWEGNIEDYNNELDSPSCWYGYKANNITNYLTPYNTAIDIDQTKGFLVSYGDGKFISAGIMNNRSSSDNVINYSSDGITWTNKNITKDVTSNWQSFTYGEGRLLYTPLVGNGECGYRDIFKRLYTLEQNPSEGDNDRFYISKIRFTVPV